MSRVELATAIAAPPERCFDLSLSVEVHLASTQPSGERVDALVLAPYLRRFRLQRNELIRRLAESDEWQAFI